VCIADMDKPNLAMLVWFRLKPISGYDFMTKLKLPLKILAHAKSGQK